MKTTDRTARDRPISTSRILLKSTSSLGSLGANSTDPQPASVDTPSTTGAGPTAGLMGVTSRPVSTVVSRDVPPSGTGVSPSPGSGPPPGWSGRTYLAFGAFELFPGFANPSNLRVTGACQLWLDPCALRSLVRTDVALVDSGGSPAFPGVALPGAACSLSCAAVVPGGPVSYFRRFAQYVADVPGNLMTMALLDGGSAAATRSNSSQFGFAFPPQNRPAAWVVRHPTTGEGLLCCTFQYLSYPTCDRPPPTCPKACVASLVLLGVSLLLAFSVVLSCTLRHAVPPQSAVASAQSCCADSTAGCAEDAEISTTPVAVLGGGQHQAADTGDGGGGDEDEARLLLRIAEAETELRRLERAVVSMRGFKGGVEEDDGGAVRDPEEEALVRRIAEAEVELRQMEQAVVRCSWMRQGSSLSMWQEPHVRKIV